MITNVYHSKLPFYYEPFKPTLYKLNTHLALILSKPSIKATQLCIALFTNFLYTLAIHHK